MFIIDGTGEGDDPLYFKDMNRGGGGQVTVTMG